MYHNPSLPFARNSLTQNAIPDIGIESQPRHFKSSNEESTVCHKVELWDAESQNLGIRLKTVGTQTLPNGFDKYVTLKKKYKKLLLQIRLQKNRYRRLLQKEHVASDASPMDIIKNLTFLRISTMEKKPIKMMKLKPFHDFIIEGAALLGFKTSSSLQMKTEDGCDIDNEDGLLYCVQEKQMVIFEPCDAETTSDDAETKISKYVLFDDSRNPSPEASSSLSWPAVYRLPKMDKLLVAQILACSTKEEAGILKCNRSFTNAFLQVIVKDVMRFTGEEGYLTRVQYQAIGTAIRREFPVLMDLDGSWETLKQKLCRKFQYERSKVCTEKRQEMRERYTPKSKQKCLKPAARHPLSKRICIKPSMHDEEVATSSRDDDTQAPVLSTNDNEADSSPQDVKGNDLSILIKSPLLRPPSPSIFKMQDIMEETKSLLEKTFDERKGRAMAQDASQEIMSCPALQCSVYLIHEAELVVRRICKMKNSPYQACQLGGIGAWTERLKKHLMHADVALHEPYKKQKFDIVQFPTDSEPMKIWRGFLSVISRAKESPDIFFEEGKETVRIAGTAFQPENVVFVDDSRIRTGNPTESICVLVASYLAFNLSHSRSQATALEILEGMLGLRISFSRIAAKNLLKAMSIL